MAQKQARSVVDDHAARRSSESLTDRIRRRARFSLSQAPVHGRDAALLYQPRVYSRGLLSAA